MPSARATLELRAVDRIEVQVLVDNVTDNLSTLPAGADITHEWAYLIREGLVTEISGDNTCCACHGLALVITVRAGDDEHTVLFDGGPAGYAVRHNGERLATDFGRIDAIVLSHGHWDHAGGLLDRARAHPRRGRKRRPRDSLLRAPGHVSQTRAIQAARTASSSHTRRSPARTHSPGAARRW